MIRVLHVVTYMGRGGLETMLMNYYRKLDRSKVQFDFLVHRDFEADYDREIVELGGRIYRLPNLNPFSKDYLTRLDQFFKEHPEYEIVHSHLDCMAGIPLKYAEKNEVRVRIAHAHNSNQTKNMKLLLKLIFKKNIKKYATDLFACGEEAGKWMFSTDRFHILNNAIDTEKYRYNEKTRQELRKELGISEDSYVIGHVGRFRHQKNHSFLIDIFAQILKRKKEAFLILVGDGETMEENKEKAERLSISEKIIFTGPRSDVHRLLQIMDCFILPSFHEGLPLSVIEAQTSGLPCFISDKVSLECKKTELVSQVSLSLSGEKWAEVILGADRSLRTDQSSQIKDAGFDITENAAWLQNYYEEQSHT